MLVSKINDISVIQVGESKLSFEHKKAQSKKPSKKDDNPFKANSGGSNKTIDLGAGQRKISVTFYTLNNADSVDLLNVLYKKRYCTLVDKFNGKMKVYIDSVDKTDSDAHVGRTVFAINAIVQEIEKTPAISAVGKLRSVEVELAEQIKAEAYTFAEQVGTVDKITDEITNEVSFFDAGMKKLEDGLNGILNLSSYPNDFMDGIRQKVNRVS